MSKSSKFASAAIGSMFFTAFGALWLSLGVLQSPWHKLAPLAFVFLVGICLFGVSLRRFQMHRQAYKNEANTPERRETSKKFNRVNAIQWCVVGLFAFLLSRLGYDQWIVPMIIFVVGAHFLPLAKVFGNPRHYLTGFSLMGAAVFYPLISSDGPVSPFGPCIAGLILWTGAVLELVSTGSKPALVSAE